ncbi:MAG: hypothetical protein H7Y61_17320 [Rhizobiales bacterium]|nr:hypothetical protein [Rhizobacter sp.]
MTELLLLMTYCTLMSSTPGPNNMMLVASGAQHGYRRTLPAILGLNAGGAAQTLVTCPALMCEIASALEQGGHVPPYPNSPTLTA